MNFQTTMWSQILRARDGSQEAMETLFARYRTPVLDYLRGRGLSEADAEDVAQEAFVRICRADFLKRADREKGKFRTLVLRVTQHVLASQFRKKYSRKRGGGRAEVPIEDLKSVVVAPEEEDRFNAAWAKHLIRLALDLLKNDAVKLGARYHDALVLRYLEGKSYKEISDALGCKMSDVVNYVYLGKARLRKHLENLTGEYSSSPEEQAEEAELVTRHAK